MDGLPVFKGTRLPVYIIFDYLAEGMKIEDILREAKPKESGALKIPGSVLPAGEVVEGERKDGAGRLGLHELI